MSVKSGQKAAEIVGNVGQTSPNRPVTGGKSLEKGTKDCLLDPHPFGATFTKPG